MTFSLDIPSATSFKAEARALREERAKAGEPISHGTALEAIARRHGYRDWNTAHAAVPERAVSPVSRARIIAACRTVSENMSYPRAR